MMYLFLTSIRNCSTHNNNNNNNDDDDEIFCNNIIYYYYYQLWEIHTEEYLPNINQQTLVQSLCREYILW